MMTGKKRAIFAAIIICELVLLIVIGSYAFFQVSQKQTNQNVVGTTCLNVTLSNESGDISLTNAWPTSDTDGASLTPYTFTVSNTCNTAVNYQIAVESIADAGKSASDYLDYSYIRVKLNNGRIKTFSSLNTLTNDTSEDYTIRDTKELSHHTLAGNSSVTYNFRLWVDENTPLQNQDESYNTNKYFYAKIKVIAGQNIEGDPEPMRVLSAENQPYATLSNIAIGDRVGFGGEEFYVVGIDGNNVKLLTKYLLNVGPYAVSGQNEGMQYERLNYNSGSYSYYMSNGGHAGAVKFADTAFWGSSTEAYDDRCNVKQYVDEYVGILNEMGLNVTGGTLISVPEITTLCGGTISANTCPSYLKYNTWYTRSVIQNSVMLRTFSVSGSVGQVAVTTAQQGVRPVITVTFDQ